MKIAVIGGTGKEGRGLALRWARAGHTVLLGSRDPARAQAMTAELAAAVGRGELIGGDNRWAVAGAGIVVLAIPYTAHRDTLTSLKTSLGGKILIDITVPIEPPHVRQVHLPKGQSAALEAQQLLGPDVRVVATLHHVSASHLADPDHGIDCDVLACSDDAEALATVLQLVGDLNLRGLDAGPLRNAVALEALTPVLLHLNRRYKSRGAGIRITGV